jgi:hypothetical protein
VGEEVGALVDEADAAALRREARHVRAVEPHGAALRADGAGTD